MVMPTKRTGSRRKFIAGAALLGMKAVSGNLTSSAEPNTGANSLIEDVPWLAEVQRPPKTSLPDAEGLRPVLVTSDNTHITTLAQWKIERQRIRNRWLEFLGPMPAERPPLRLIVVREDRLDDGGTRQLVRYESEVGRPVEGYLLRPKSNRSIKKRAGIVALHPTSPDNIHEIAGVMGRPGRDLGVQLCKRGFIVFCPQCFLWQDAATYKEATDNFRKRRPSTLGMHKMLWDAMRGVDVLASLSDEVDAKRIGATGH